MKTTPESLFAVQDIGRVFNGVHQYGVEYHAIEKSDTCSNPKPALCGFIPSRHGNGWGWDISLVSCEKCRGEIK